MNEPPPPGPRPLGLPKYLAALISWVLLASAGAGLLDWRFDAGPMASGDTLAGHLAWRTFSATTSATVCGLILYSLVRPLTPGRATAATVLPTLAGMQRVTREHFLQHLILVAITSGLIAGTLLLLTSWASRRRARTPRD